MRVRFQNSVVATSEFTMDFRSIVLNNSATLNCTDKRLFFFHEERESLQILKTN